ncbi:hypothetical protein D1140_21350 [Salmonella enterica subsp. enterica serovar Amager]|nr:hypothetical protein [Salmonella enterica subsp. enterica serovar Amager]ECV0539142.1 hypothetical protein [Salmonella enterica subsp. enterica serovar Amager]ECV4621562.1 hypothetical protein [Salmonella enterica subsp. enterica serovar Amager]
MNVDIRKIFESISLELTAKFQRTVQVQHSGGKGANREDAFSEFLRDYLPNKYGVGRGEVISPDNDISGELDIVIFDKNHCPLFLKSDSHSLYPRESVFGAVSMKSHLDSEELKDAYKNIASLKKIMAGKKFNKPSNSGFVTTLCPVVPVTAVFAYAANRSLEAIAKQVIELDKELDDIRLRPDFVVVLGLGIVGPNGKIRDSFNEYKLPQELDKLSLLRTTGRHTLLRFYMQLLDELNSITQPELNLNLYFNMPSRVGKYKVSGHDRLIVTFDGEDERTVKRLTLSAIDRIVKGSNMVTYKQHLLNYLGALPEGVEHIYDMSSPIYEYNPQNKPPIQILWDENNRPIADEGSFQALYIEIDGNKYAIDANSITKDDFELNPDYTVSELMSQ